MSDVLSFMNDDSCVGVMGFLPSAMYGALCMVLSGMLLPTPGFADELVQAQTVASSDISDAITSKSVPSALSQASVSAPQAVTQNPSIAQIAITVQSPAKANDEQQFLRCANVSDGASRLACYDALAVGAVPNGFESKRPVHLSGTLRNVINLNPHVARADDSIGTHADLLVESSKNAQVLTEIGVSDKDLARYTPLSLAYDLDKNSQQGLWSARPHNANYFLPLYINGKPNRAPHTPTQVAEAQSANQMRTPELKFQLSLKTKALQNLFGTDADLWVGYTQQSHWQVYNEDHSRPFRAHDYEPEVFMTQPVAADLPFGGRLRMLGVGAVHHSNGESNPWSRSWNRAYLMAGAEFGKLTVVPRVWTRMLKNDSGARPDDNPDILDYYGYGDVKFLYQLDRGKNVSGLVRYNPATGKGALQIDYVHPIGRGISGYVQIFQGYGQSLIDYNHEATSIGFGVMLSDWMGL